MTFRPTSVGEKSATLKAAVLIGGSASVRAASLSGTGVAASYSITPTSLAFGNLRVGATSASKWLTIKNTGAGVLPITSIKLAGTNPGQFALTHACAAEVPKGSQCAARVVFKPTSRGIKSASVVVTAGGGAPVKTVPVSGSGI